MAMAKQHLNLWYMLYGLKVLASSTESGRDLPSGTQEGILGIFGRSWCCWPGAGGLISASGFSLAACCMGMAPTPSNCDFFSHESKVGEPH